jgi:outer membrane protein insertion porin family
MRYLIFFLFCSNFMLAQKPSYELICKSASDYKKLNALLEKNFADSTFKCPQIVRSLQTEGFWLATCNLKDSILIIQANSPLKLGKLRLQKIKYLATEDDYSASNALLTDENLESQLQGIITKFNDAGFPFAVIEFTNYEISDNTLDADFSVSTGPQIRLDSLVILGYDKIANGILKYEIGYRPGMYYSDKRLKKIEQNISTLPYLQAKRSPAVAFFRKNSILYLYLEKANNNQVTGIVGLNTNAEGRTTLNGDFQLALQNTFNRGEEIGLRWRSPDESIEDFKLSFGYPFIFNSPLGLSTDLAIFRQDSSFVNRKVNGQASYWLASNSYLLAAIEFTSSSALSANANSPSNLNDFTTTKIKLGIDLSTLNNRIVASSGYRIQALGLSAIRRTNTNSINQFGWELKAENYWNFSGNWVYFSGFLSEALFSEQLFENELYRLGGIKTLRGFNELSFFSSAYGVLQNEIRFMLGPKDYLTVFSDLAYTEKKELNKLNPNWHLGLGTGLNFQTKAGIFSLFLAVGKSNQADFDFRNTKVHISYINTF